MSRKSETQLWENELLTFDVTAASKAVNPWLKDYGKDRLSYRGPENYFYKNVEAFENEAKQSHGYPTTFYLQLAIVYGAGLYTAKE